MRDRTFENSENLLSSKRSTGVIPDVNLINPLHVGNEASFEIHYKDHQKSKTGISVVPQKNYCPLKSLKIFHSVLRGFLHFLIFIFQHGDIRSDLPETYQDLNEKAAVAELEVLFYNKLSFI